MEQICPYCHKPNHIPDASADLAGWQIACAHCQALFVNALAEAPTAGQKPRHYACPACDQPLSVTSHEARALTKTILLCPACRTPLTLSPMTSHHWRLFFKCGFLCLLLIGSLWLVLTPHGSQLVTYIAGLLPSAPDYLFHANDALYDFLAFLQGLFL